MMIHIQDKDINIDKKYIIIGAIALIIIIVLLLFPKNNSLKCTLKKEDFFSRDEEVYEATFKSNKLDKLEVSVKYNFTENYIHMLDNLYEQYKYDLDKLKSAGGYDYIIEKGNDYIFYKATIDLNKIPDATKISVGFNNEWNFKDFKENLESNNFKCN